MPPATSVSLFASAIFLLFFNAVKVGSGKISTSQGATTDTKYVQQVKFTVKFYNFPSIAQDAVANGNYKGAFFIKNEACSSVPRS